MHAAGLMSTVTFLPSELLTKASRGRTTTEVHVWFSSHWPSTSLVLNSLCLNVTVMIFSLVLQSYSLVFTQLRNKHILLKSDHDS